MFVAIRRRTCIHTLTKRICSSGIKKKKKKEINNVHKAVARESRKFPAAYFINDLRNAYANVPTALKR